MFQTYLDGRYLAEFLVAGSSTSFNVNHGDGNVNVLIGVSSGTQEQSYYWEKLTKECK